MRGHTRPSMVAEQYYVRGPYRQRIYRDWLFLTIEPGMDFFARRTTDSRRWSV